jgi:hypothetical protein
MHAGDGSCQTRPARHQRRKVYFMQTADRTAVAGIAAGLAGAVMTALLEKVFPDTSIWIWQSFFVASALTLAFSFAFLADEHLCRPYFRRTIMAPALLIIISSLGFIAGIAWALTGKVLLLTESFDHAPDVTARFVYPKFPSLVLVNQSSKIARQIKWSAAIWNLDDPRTYVNPNPAENAHDPLPIPAATFDFLRPHASGGPQTLFNEQYIKPGQRLFGSVSVICPECSRGHTYIVSIVWGGGGWYTEILESQEGELVIPSHFTKDLVASYYTELLKLISESSRAPIGES